MEEFAALMMLGVRVREVRDLAERCMWLPKALILLIDANLTPSERRSVADQVLPRAQRLSHLDQIVDIVDIGDLVSAETPGDITAWS